jgi:hypothetical protein
MLTNNYAVRAVQLSRLAGYQVAHQACAITDGEHTPVERLNLSIAVQNLHTDCDPLLWQDVRGQM